MRSQRALFDANILISYLLPSTKERVVTAIVEAAVEGTFTLLLPPELVAEFSRKIATKKYLAQRIHAEDAARLIDTLTAVAEILPPLPSRIPFVTRDLKDDYLLACALLGRADYLVTGDGDLLTLGEVGGVKIVSPADFLKVLKAPKEEAGEQDHGQGGQDGRGCRES